MFNFKGAVVIAAFCCISQSSGQGSFTDKGGIWLGSSISYFNVSTHGFSENVFLLSPFFRGFATNHFAMGCKLNWLSVSDDNSSMSVVSPGVDLTLAGGRDQAIIYFTPGFKVDFYSESYTEYDWYTGSTYNHSSSNTGTTFSIYGGVIVRIKDIVALQIEPGFDFKTVESNNETVFHFSIGFCGIGQKAAVSVLQNFPGL